MNEQGCRLVPGVQLGFADTPGQRDAIRQTSRPHRSFETCPIRPIAHQHPPPPTPTARRTAVDVEPGERLDQHLEAFVLFDSPHTQQERVALAQTKATA